MNTKKRTKPILPIHLKQTEKIGFRVNKTEKETLERQMKTIGFKRMSPFLKAKALSKTVSIACQEQRKDDHLTYELNKMGVLLNQIARKINRYSLEQQQRILLNSEAQTLKKIEELLHKVIMETL